MAEPIYTSQAGRLTLSRIFLWFASDFGGHAGVPLVFWLYPYP